MFHKHIFSLCRCATACLAGLLVKECGFIRHTPAVVKSFYMSAHNVARNENQADMLTHDVTSNCKSTSGWVMPKHVVCGCVLRAIPKPCSRYVRKQSHATPRTSTQAVRVVFFFNTLPEFLRALSGKRPRATRRVAEGLHPIPSDPRNNQHSGTELPSASLFPKTSALSQKRLIQESIPRVCHRTLRIRSRPFYDVVLAFSSKHTPQWSVGDPSDCRLSHEATAFLSSSSSNSLPPLPLSIQ